MQRYQSSPITKRKRSKLPFPVFCGLMKLSWSIHSALTVRVKSRGRSARVVDVPFNGFGDLRNRAIEACHFDWIFSLDSDERCIPEVRDEILTLLASSPQHEIYMVPRRSYMMGRWIRGTGWYPNFRQPQLFRKGSIRYTLEPIHEGFEAIGDRAVGTLRNAIWQFPFRNLEEVINKMNRYSTLGAPKLGGKRVSMATAFGHAAWSFIKHYIFKLGFIDGWAGLSSRSEILKARSIATPNVTNRRRTGNHLQASRSGSKSRLDRRAQSARKIAQNPKWQGQVIFAQDLPAIGPLALAADSRVRTNRCTAPDDAIAGPEKVPVLRKVADVIFQYVQVRLPARDVEAAQNFDFVTLHIDREKIESDRSAGFGRDAVQRPNRYTNDPFGHGPRRHVVSVERGQRPCNMERQIPAGIFG
jgi:hypothetical protein